MSPGCDGQSAGAEPFDWPLAMAMGLGALKLAPAAFWAMTPREFDAALEGHFGRRRRDGALSRPDLDALMDMFPDLSEEPTDDAEHGPIDDR